MTSIAYTFIIVFLFSKTLEYTLYFNGMKLKTHISTTANNRNKWHAGGQWFLGQDQVTP